jgi:hypothetical protein
MQLKQNGKHESIRSQKQVRHSLRSGHSLSVQFARMVWATIGYERMAAPLTLIETSKVHEITQFRGLLTA